MIYTPPHRPYAHQQAALDKMGDKPAFALLMEMRTGKSKCLLDNFGQLELDQKCQDLCVIAPNGVLNTWFKAAQDHLSFDLKQRTKIARWVSGASLTERRILKTFIDEKDGNPRIFLVNVEALSAVKAARDAAVEFLSSRNAMLAIDESTIIGNHSSQRTKFINGKLAPLAAYRRILSGLPAPRDPLNLFSQFEFLNWRILGHRSFFSYRARYAIMVQMLIGGRSIPLVKGWRDLEEIQEKIAPHSHRVLLSECYDLPPKTYAVREVELTSEQKRLYKEMKDFASAKIKDEAYVTATVVVAQLTRLQQILCGHTVDEQGQPHNIPENRTAALIDLMQDFNGKAIIWANFGHDIIKIAAALEKEFGPGSTAQFWGGNVKTREQDEQRFLNDPQCRFLVATAAAGGKGRTWTVASMIVYYSNNFDLEARMQSEERAQAVGKADPVAYVDLQVPGTIDEKLVSALRAKINLSTTLMGDKWREWLV